MIEFILMWWMYRVERQRHRPHEYWPLTARYIRPAKISRRNRPAWKGPR